MAQNKTDTYIKLSEYKDINVILRDREPNKDLNILVDCDKEALILDKATFHNINLIGDKNNPHTIKDIRMRALSAQKVTLANFKAENVAITNSYISSGQIENMPQIRNLTFDKLHSEFPIYVENSQIDNISNNRLIINNEEQFLLKSNTRKFFYSPVRQEILETLMAQNEASKRRQEYVRLHKIKLRMTPNKVMNQFVKESADSYAHHRGVCISETKLWQRFHRKFPVVTAEEYQKYCHKTLKELEAERNIYNDKKTYMQNVYYSAVAANIIDNDYELYTTVARNPQNLKKIKSYINDKYPDITLEDMDKINLSNEPIPPHTDVHKHNIAFIEKKIIHDVIANDYKFDINECYWDSPIQNQSVAPEEERIIAAQMDISAQLIQYKQQNGKYPNLPEVNEYIIKNYQKDKVVGQYKQQLLQNVGNYLYKASSKQKMSKNSLAAIYYDRIAQIAVNSQGKFIPARLNDDLTKRCLEKRISSDSFNRGIEDVQTFNLSDTYPKEGVFEHNVKFISQRIQADIKQNNGVFDSKKCRYNTKEEQTRLQLNYIDMMLMRNQNSGMPS